ncbi:MAG TPA: hypothetical protein VIS07_19975 [Candidatus Binatia bacterium]
MSLTDEQIELYSRQILLRELGGVGQRRLLAASVLALGDGVAADAALSYLAGAGVGRIDRLASASRSRPDPDADAGALALAPLAERSPDAQVRLLDEPPASLETYDVVLAFSADDAREPASSSAGASACLPAGAPRLGSIAVRDGGGALEVVLLPRGHGCLACLASAAVTATPQAERGAAEVAQRALAGTLAALACCRWLAAIGPADDVARALRLAADGATWDERAPERSAACPRGCPPPAQPVLTQSPAVR